jgi:DNA-3-methyladenine glycosylase I
MALNARWHAAHPMPPRPTETDRLLWHVEHEKACGCRPMPKALQELAHPKKLPRCHWAGEDPLMIHYHDTEWGTPSHDAHHLFEMLILEGAQAGLSWSTILKKRDGYRRAFARFDAKKIAALGPKDVERLMNDPGIVKNRLKIESTISNAKAFLDLQKSHPGGFDAFVWSFVGGKPMVRRPASFAEVPARTPESDAMSKALVKKGFRFVGSTICYAYMQACGLVDDHAAGCFRAAKKSR